MRGRNQWIAVAGALALAVLALGACKVEETMARKRVETVLEQLKIGGVGTGGDTQLAIAQWANPSNVVEMSALAKAETDFLAWTREKDIDHQISSYEIKGVEPDGSSSSTFIVSVVIEGQPHRIRVPARDAMSWAD